MECLLPGSGPSAVVALPRVGIFESFTLGFGTAATAAAGPEAVVAALLLPTAAAAGAPAEGAVADATLAIAESRSWSVERKPAQHFSMLPMRPSSSPRRESKFPPGGATAAMTNVTQYKAIRQGSYAN